MNARIILVFTILIVAFWACRSTQRRNPPPAINLAATFPMVDSVDVYNHDIVDSFVPTTEAAVYARKLYLNAIDLLANKNDAKGSVPLFLRSLRIAPAINTYLKYGDALYGAGQYDNASQAYYFTLTDSTARGEGYMGIARCLATTGDSMEALSELNEALSAYPFDIKAVENDKAFEQLRYKEAFKIMMVKYNGGDAHRSAALLAMFERNFDKASLPYSIPPDSLAKNDGTQVDFRYTDFIEGMTDGEFSRMVEKEYQYVVSLNLQPGYKSFIYRTVDYVGDTIYPTNYFLVTVDTNGVKIAQQEIACSCSPLTIKTVAIDTDGIIEVKEIAQTWKQDPTDKGYADNQVVKQEVTATTLYKVAADGKIASLTERPAKSNAPVQVSQ